MNVVDFIIIYVDNLYNKLIFNLFRLKIKYMESKQPSLIEKNKYSKFPDFIIITKDDIKIPISKEILCYRFMFFRNILDDELTEYEEKTDFEIVSFLFDTVINDEHEFLFNLENKEHQELFKNYSLLYFKWDCIIKVKNMPYLEVMYPFIHGSIPAESYIEVNRWLLPKYIRDDKHYDKYSNTVYTYIGKKFLKNLNAIGRVGMKDHILHNLDLI